MRNQFSKTALLCTLQKNSPDIEKSFSASLHSVCIDTFPGWKKDGQDPSFLEKYGV